MLIRSQDKRMIVNLDNICTVSAFPEKDSEDIYVEDGTGSLMVGRYSTKSKSHESTGYDSGSICKWTY